ncbi:metal-dependent hydrolase [Natronoglycomyces albus]|uniref:Metal-dependent hydrolase n=2 Tax=Natronoglycomyces albus TaxID=2811108 RepID=A0A895XM14_9ACTN|nr:metal-dependent hydrolase [Natronoglycomyces albus]QSB04583.1 metal-dependent hydrolase [Natronoglycomyces albus]
MGPTHAMSGAAAWLGASAIASSFFDIHQHPAELAVGTIICAGAALFPDIDCAGRVLTNRGGSTVARSFGRVSMVLANIVERLCIGIYMATRTKKDGTRRNGHRTFTHTWVFAILMGFGTGALASNFGKPAVIGILFFLTGLAVRGLMANTARDKGWIITTGASLVCAFGMFHVLPPDRSYALLGIAMAMGCFIHTLGDMITKMGCPVLFPIPIAGKVWYDVGLPDFMALRAGGVAEKKYLMPALTILTLIGMFWNVPEVQTMVTGLIRQA